MEKMEEKTSEMKDVIVRNTEDEDGDGNEDEEAILGLAYTLTMANCWEIHRMIRLRCRIIYQMKKICELACFLEKAMLSFKFSGVESQESDVFIVCQILCHDGSIVCGTLPAKGRRRARS